MKKIVRVLIIVIGFFCADWFADHNESSPAQNTESENGDNSSEEYDEK